MNPLREALGEEKYAAHLRRERITVQPHEASRFQILMDEQKDQRIKGLEAEVRRLHVELGRTRGEVLRSLRSNHGSPSLELIYIAGPYSSDIPAQRALNIHDAVRFGQAVRAFGFVPMVPHVTILPTDPTEAGYELAMRECFELIRRCDALIVMPTWRKSPGATREREYAESLGMPIFEDLAALQEVADAVA